MGKCCSKPQVKHRHQETHQVLIDIDPGGVTKMTGGTLVARSPGRWGVATSPKIVTTSGAPATKTARGTRGAAVARTYHFSSGGGPGCAGGVTLLTGAKVTQGANNRPFYNITPISAGKRMGKTKTTKETSTRTYTQNGKRYEETVEVTTVEDDGGNVKKTTTTSTRCIDDAFSTKKMKDAIEGTKTRQGVHRSSSSSDSSPTRTKSSKDKKPEKSSASHKSSAEQKSKGGLLSKMKGGAKSDDGDSSDDEEFVKGVHKTVNEYRVKHGVAKLKFSKEMSRYAKQWAKKLATDEKMSHQPDSQYGENLFCLTSNSKNFKVKSDEVVGKWYGECEDHKFGGEPEGGLLKTGHFTQLVWKDSKQMGVGKARNAAGTKVFVVANFDPQGNWMGQFASQVPPVGGFPRSGKLTGLFSGSSSKSRKSSSSSDSDSSSDEEDFVEDCLKVHNVYRKKHGVPALKHSKKLSKYAKEWAETIAKKDVMQHRSTNEYGENLYTAWSSNPKYMIKAQEAVESWYSEIKDFTFGKEPRDLAAGHFTQVVWSDTKELGVAYARSKSGKLYVVANYSPAGNYVGSFATKVPRVK